MGIIILFVLVGIEIGLLILRLKTKSNQNKWKNRIRIGTFVGMVLLVILQLLKLSFAWYFFFIVLTIQAILALVYFWKQSRKYMTKPEKSYKTLSTVMVYVRRSVFLIFLLIPALLFPQYKSLAASGVYEVETVSYTLEDTDRIEHYSKSSESRKVTIEFWYPEMEGNEKEFPLVIFSHGAFGYRGSNYSTFMELASNGYVVCSIDHTYQSFFTKQTDGKVVVVDQTFLNDATAVQSETYEPEKIYELTHDWLETRTSDMNFVLETILEKVDAVQEDEVFQRIDIDQIGLFGHSLGGATAAQIGRSRGDIDAVIVLDGTMIGESIAFENGSEVLIDEAYPVPILNVYNEEHYQDALDHATIYANMVINEKAVDAKQTVFMGSGHLNFTDLPLFSPFLANALGTGEIDRKFCIETMNEIILSYFNHYLKGTNELNIQDKY